MIISDAMRYEIGDQLPSLIRQEDRYSAELEATLAMLPSYTQLGMAALLPNKTLAITDNDTGTVLVDGQSSQGTVNRSKVLQAALNGRGQAVIAKAFMSMNSDEARELLKANDVVHIYHNRIDHTGDKIHSEGQAFEATEQTLDDLIRLVKKLAAANANNLLITADHGFISTVSWMKVTFPASKRRGLILFTVTAVLYWAKASNYHRHYARYRPHN